MTECPECFECEGEGVLEVEIECPCDGCFNGEHEIETECGMLALAPCDRCNGEGWITKKIYPCYNCDGRGIDHEWGNWQLQSTLDGKTLEYRVCKNCNAVMYRSEFEKVKEKRNKLDRQVF